MIGTFKDNRAGWRCNFKHPVLVVIKEMDHVTHANIVSSPITGCQRSKGKTKKSKGDPQRSLSQEAAKLSKRSSRMNLINKMIFNTVVLSSRGQAGKLKQ